MSNPGSAFDGSSAAAPTIICRQAREHEIEPALRLLLAGPARLATDEQLRDFLSFAAERRMDLNAIWIAERGGQVAWTLLPLLSPGRTALLFSPTRMPGPTGTDPVQALVQAISDDLAARETLLAQMLVDPAESAIVALYQRCGFMRLTDLVYLHRSLPRRVQLPVVPDGLTIANYSAEGHDLFARAIKLSYEASLDCPALNGMREIEDVIAGHQATGEFDPRLWFVVCRDNAPIATLLLGRSHGDAIELVYLGVAPEARGKGLGDWLMRLALRTTSAQRRASLSLAVDGNNAPALALYHRHGMKQVGKRVALLRDLRVGRAAKRERVE